MTKTINTGNLRRLKASRRQLVLIALKSIPKMDSDEENLDNLVEIMFSKTADKYFRGWILPNGKTISQYQKDDGKRQDHSKIMELFIEGLKDTYPLEYLKMLISYNNYVSKNHNCRDIFESFAVESLGWIQISENGKKRVICRGERWQDKFIDSFINKYNFELIISKNGLCINHLFSSLYGDSEKIIKKGLQKIHFSQNKPPKIK